MNWGTGLTVAIVSFCLFILTFVFLMSRHEVDLVREDYYQEELRHSQRMDKEDNVNKHGGMTLRMLPEEIEITFDNILSEEDSIHGELLFYRPSNKDLDRKNSFGIAGQDTLRYNKSSFQTGSYVVKSSWNKNGKAFYQEQKIIIE